MLSLKKRVSKQYLSSSDRYFIAKILNEMKANKDIQIAKVG